MFFTFAFSNYQNKVRCHFARSFTLCPMFSSLWNTMSAFANSKFSVPVTTPELSAHIPPFHILNAPYCVPLIQFSILCFLYYYLHWYLLFIFMFYAPGKSVTKCWKQNRSLVTFYVCEHVLSTLYSSFHSLSYFNWCVNSQSAPALKVLKNRNTF